MTTPPTPPPWSHPSSSWWAQFPTHQSLVSHRSQILSTQFASGTYEPFIWPYSLFGFYAVFLYLLVPPNNSRLYFYARYPIYCFSVAWFLRSIWVCRSHVPPVQYGIGLINSYACLWLGVHLLWRDTRTGSRRVVWRELRPEGGRHVGSRGSGSGSGSAGGVDGAEDGDVKGDVRAKANGSTSSARADGSAVKRMVSIKGEAAREEPFQVEKTTSNSKPGLNPLMHLNSSTTEYYWQPLPASLLERFYWVCTMIMSLRGEGTTHGIRQLPRPPASTRLSLRRNSPDVPEPLWIADERSTLQVKSTKRGMILSYIATCAVTYLMLDLAKNLIERDPYFTGFVPITSPLPLPSAVTDMLPASLSSLPSNPLFAQMARSGLSLFAILALLINLTSLPPLLFSGLLGLRDQPWLYPTTFGGTYMTTLVSAGIAGWWGRYWHQLFRLSFEAPLPFLCRILRIEKTTSTAGRLVGMFLAFTLSATLHAAGSYTLNGPGTRPWLGSGAFFLIQPIGILIEQLVRYSFSKLIPILPTLPLLRTSPPLPLPLQNLLKKILAFTWVHLWLLLTARLLTDDVALGGVWTTEVVPVSLVDGMLFGGGRWVRWEWWMMPRLYVDGERWWRSGIAF